MTPVETARQALRLLTELGLPPTPENYEVQYRAIAGLPAQEPRLDPATAARMLEMVRALLSVMAQANEGLHADLTRFSQQSSSLMAELKGSSDPSALEELFKAMTASSAWLLGQVDSARRELSSTREQLRHALAELERQQGLAVTDALTSLLNRRGIGIVLAREFSRARRAQTSLCVAMVDIDNFKRINDEFGHAAGDRALVHFREVIKPAVRGGDVVGRYGGEEFLLILPDTEMVGAEFLLNRLLSRLEHTPLSLQGTELALGFSAGVAQWREGETEEELIDRADRAMYRAKRSGRGRVEVAEAQPAPEFPAERQGSIADNASDLASLP